MHTQIGHYQIVSELGRGGMGVVYKGYEPALSRHVAIKLMSEALAHQPEVVERFLREARAMGQLSDPHIVQIYFIGEHAGQPFFAMEFVEGETLAERLRREGRMEPAEAAGLLLQAAQGLSVAHELGVIHRDIKPANLMLTPRGLLKVTDFGIALAQRDAAAKLTGTGQFVGTPGYLSPEVCLGHAIDVRSDVFALGIVFFEMLAGRLPFTDASPLGMMLEVVQSSIPDIRTINAGVPAELVAILQRMLEKDPARRYPDCEALIADLQAAGAVVRRAVVAALPGSGAASGPVTARSTPSAASTLRAPTPGVAATMPLAPRPAAGPPTLPPQSPPTLPRAIAQPPVVPPSLAAPSRRGAHVGIAVAALVLMMSVVAVAAINRDRISGWFREEAGPMARAEPELKSAASSSARAPASAVEPVAAGTVSSGAVAAADGQPPSAPVATADGQLPSDPVATVSADAPVSSVGLPAEAGAEPAVDAQMAEMRRLAAELDEKARQARQAQAELEAARNVTPAVPTPADAQAKRATREALATEPRAAAPAAPPAPPPMPAVPRVAVLAFGDPMLAGPAELAVESALEADGYLLADEDQMPGIRRLKAARTPPIVELLQLARRSGVSGIVLIRVNDLGTQTLSYYGQSSQVTSATIELAVHDVVGRDRRARSTSETIQYTGLNAVERARQAVGPQLDGVLVALAPYRRGG
jgi:hypothetical protein